MGLIKALAGSVGGVLADQWKEFFYCESLSTDVLVAKGQKRTSKRSSNTKGDENIITTGSVISVNDGQCVILVDQGKVAEICAEPGEFTYDASTEPSIFCGSLGQGIKETFKKIGRRFTFGGDTAHDQRVYYVNTKEILGNKYGTTNPVPFRVVDRNINLDLDAGLKCHGEFSFRIIDPILFYTNVCANVSDEYRRESIDSQLKTELLTALQPALAKISAMGVRYSEVPAHTKELAQALDEELTAEWKDHRGIEIETFGVSSVTLREEDEKIIKDAQRNAINRDPQMAAATLVGSQAQAMQDAANNESGGGAFMGFAGMNMAQNVGGQQAANMFNMAGATGSGKQTDIDATSAQMQANQAAMNAGKPGNDGAVPPAGGPDGQTPPAGGAEGAPQGGGQVPPPAAPGAGEWTCSCGTANSGNFCSNCGSPKPAPTGVWTCDCGTENNGNFCSNCGKPRK